MTVTIAGVVYKVELNPSSMGYPEWVVVWDKDENLLASAEIDITLETIKVDYPHTDRNMGDDPDESYDYKNYKLMKDLHGVEEGAKDLARNMIYKVEA